MSLVKSLNLIDSVDYFMKQYAPFASTIPFSRRSRFVILDHCVRETEFTIKIYYDKEQFGHLITQFVNEMIRETKGNEELNIAGWDNTVVFVDETERASEYFEYFCFVNS